MLKKCIFLQKLENILNKFLLCKLPILKEYPDYEYVDPREQVRAPPQPHYQAYQPETSAPGKKIEFKKIMKLF